jgi:hypothetical protein
MFSKNTMELEERDWGMRERVLSDEQRNIDEPMKRRTA